MPDLVAETTDQSAQPDRPELPAAITEVTADDEQTPSAPPAKTRSLRSVLVQVFRVAVVLVIAGFIVSSTMQNWAKIKDTLHHIAWESLALSLVAVLLGYIANTFGWRAALADLEFKAPITTTGRIYLVGQLAKYIPGTVWAFVLQMELGRRAGLPRARAFLASLVATGLGLTAGLVVGMLVLPSLFNNVKSSEGGTIILYGVMALVPVALFCAHPRVLTFLVQVFLKLMRRKPLDHRLSWPGVLKVVGWSTVGLMFFGLHLWLLTNSLGAPGFKGLFVCIGALSLAMVASILFVLSPSGLGAREAVLTAALTPFLPSAGIALAVALVSRVVFTVADLLAAGLATLSSMRYLRHGHGHVPVPPPPED